MSSYEEQLTSLKTHISQLQEDFGEFENLKELHEMVTNIYYNIRTFNDFIQSAVTLSLFFFYNR